MGAGLRSNGGDCCVEGLNAVGCDRLEREVVRVVPSLTGGAGNLEKCAKPVVTGLG